MEGSSPCITSTDNIPLGFEPGEPSSMNKCSRFLCAEGLGGSPQQAKVQIDFAHDMQLCECPVLTAALNASLGCLACQAVGEWPLHFSISGGLVHYIPEE